MLLGAIAPDDGTIYHRRPSPAPGPLEGDDHVGFSAGYLPLPEPLKVREALGVFAGLYGMRDAKAAIAEALERFGIAHLADRMCVQLS